VGKSGAAAAAGVGTGGRRCRNGRRVVVAVEVGVPLTRMLHKVGPSPLSGLLAAFGTSFLLSIQGQGFWRIGRVLLRGVLYLQNSSPEVAEPGVQFFTIHKVSSE
jgi:hypothetical protein